MTRFVRHTIEGELVDHRPPMDPANEWRTVPEPSRAAPAPPQVAPHSEPVGGCLLALALAAAVVNGAVWWLVVVL